MSCVPAAMSEVAYYLGLSKVTIAWRLEEQELEFSTQYIDFPKKHASDMYRESELAYIAACNTPFVIPFFALNVRGDPSQLKHVYIQAIRVLVAGRVRVTVLTDKLAELKTKIRALKDLLSQCDDKLQFNLLRTEMYEEEMNRLSADNPFKSPDRFSSFLSNTVGFAAVSKIMVRESRRLNAPPLTDEEAAAAAGEDREPTWEEANHISIDESLEDLLYSWDLLQHWQVIHAVCVRCRFGPQGYPVTTGIGQPAARSVKGGLRRSIRPGWGERSFGERYSEQYVTSPTSQAAERPALLMRSQSGIDTLVPIVAGNGVGPWEAICEALGELAPTDRIESDTSLIPQSISSLVVSCRRILDMVKSPFLMDVVSRVSMSNLAAAVGDLDDLAEQCSSTANALFQVLADMGKHFENRLLLRLRTSSLWIPTLVDLRKSRVKREGGKLVVRDDGDVEISADGKLRTIPFADDYVDSDVLHGSIQRLKVQIAAPRCRVILKENTDLLVQLHGERSCAAQLMYSIALPLLQRVMRTAIIRRRYLQLRRVLIVDSIDAAAAIIQSWLVGCRTRAWYRVARAARRLWACTVIQRYGRGFVARRRARNMLNSRMDNSKDVAATKLQALIRGVLARRRVAEQIAAGTEETLKEAQNWGVVIIQKLARGYIARKTIIRSYRIRSTLSKPILKLTEKYLLSGNLWSFLSELDETMKRVTDQLQETEEREDNWAETFVNKVVNHRKKQFDGAWNAFDDALSLVGKAGPMVGESSSDGAERDPVLTATGRVKGPLLNPHKRHAPKASGETCDIQGLSRSTGASVGHIAVPGVLLRRAITTTVAEGMKQKETFVKASISTLAKQRDDIQSAYSSDTTIKTATTGSAITIKKRTGLTVQPNRGSKKNKGKIGASSTDWVTAAGQTGALSSGTTTSGDAKLLPMKTKNSQYTRQQHLEFVREGDMSPRKQLLVPVKLSDFLLLDIPLGIADKVDRLLYAAALRCFVPDFFPHHSLQEAYAMYRQMPNGLMKVRYEQSAYSWSQPLVSKLRMKGLNTIGDLMPLSKCDMFLRSVGTPLTLLDTAKDIIAVLEKLGKFPMGLPHARTKSDTEKMLEAGTVTVLEPQGMNEYGRSTKIAKTSDAVKSDSSPSLCPRVVGLTFAESFLKKAVSEGSWAEMSAPVDELLLHAAFLVCPNVDEVNRVLEQYAEVSIERSNHSVQYDLATIALGDGYKGFKRVNVSEFDPKKKYYPYVEEGSDRLDVFGNDKAITLHGHDYFVKFAQYLDYIASTPGVDSVEIESSQREAIRERYRTALLLSTPFELSLKASGVNSVSQLARYDLSVLELPQLYRTQIESMISTAIAAAVGVKETDNVNTGRHLPPVNNQIAFKVPLLYNNKYQRGPFDPYGIPPRMGISTSLDSPPVGGKPNAGASSRKGKLKGSTRHRSNDIDAPGDLPSDLWTASKCGSSLTSEKVSNAINKGTNDILAGRCTGNKLQDQVDLSTGRSLESFFSTIPGPRAAHVLREKKEHEGTFERPYKCLHGGCREAFSRPYTLRMHEKSHLTEYKDYMKYRTDPQYTLDADSTTRALEDESRFEMAASLPRYIQKQLDSLR